jgi:hypothetical protein
VYATLHPRLLPLSRSSNSWVQPNIPLSAKTGEDAVRGRHFCLVHITYARKCSLISSERDLSPMQRVKPIQIPLDVFDRRRVCGSDVSGQISLVTSEPTLGRIFRNRVVKNLGTSTHSEEHHDYHASRPLPPSPCTHRRCSLRLSKPFASEHVSCHCWEGRQGRGRSSSRFVQSRLLALGGWH